MVASEEAVTDVDSILRQLDKDRAGVIWGSGIGGL
jgi:3-oxoacyl-[acyl-carrier-protein] synthase II